VQRTYKNVCLAFTESALIR